MARSNAFTDGDPNAALLTIATPQVQQPIEEPPALEMDPVLLDIFSKETAGHLKVIGDYRSACEGYSPPFQVTDKLYRACHTLHGSANMANVERGVAVASALNRFVRRVYDHRTGLQQSGLNALGAAAQALQKIVADINQADVERADFSVLIELLNKLTDAVESPEQIVKAAEPVVETTEVPQLENTEEMAYDAEIAAIFSEEAAELLESADQALANWSANRNAREYVEELKRHLHTLKGGARMAVSPRWAI
jgi:chemosensory pili system protein ChpA (sensor histidine kinase/response regulator)